MNRYQQSQRNHRITMMREARNFLEMLSMAGLRVSKTRNGYLFCLPDVANSEQTTCFTFLFPEAEQHYIDQAELG